MKQTNPDKTRFNKELEAYYSKDYNEFETTLKENNLIPTKERTNLYDLLNEKEDKNYLLTIKGEYKIETKTLYESIQKLDEKRKDYELIEKASKINNSGIYGVSDINDFSKLLDFFILFPEASVEDFYETRKEFKEIFHIKDLQTMNVILSEYQGYSLEDALRNYSNYKYER